jgi:hypothetical protein
MGLSGQDTMYSYDFTIGQEVLNEFAAEVWAEYVAYCDAHNIDIMDMKQPMAVKTQLVYDYKRKIIETGECETIEDLEPIKNKLQEMRDELVKLKEKEQA